MPRLFLALPVSDKVRYELTVVQHDLQQTFRHSRVNWVTPENFHITLHFIGDVSEKQCIALAHVLAEPIHIPAFVLHLTDVNAFPSPKNPQTVFVGTNVHPSLPVLHRRLADRLLAHRLTIDTRQFHPHITLGRMQNHAEVLPCDMTVTPMEFDVTSFQLMQSALTTAGSVYNLVQEFPLEM